MKVSLLEQPRLSYGLIIQGGDISFLPGLETFINDILRNSVLEQYTLPGGYTLPLLPGGGREVCCLSPPICDEYLIISHSCCQSANTHYA